MKLGIQGATVAIGYPMLTGEGVGGAASAAIYRVVSANMQAGTFSELGRYYSDLIQRFSTTH